MMLIVEDTYLITRITQNTQN